MVTGINSAFPHVADKEYLWGVRNIHTVCCSLLNLFLDLSLNLMDFFQLNILLWTFNNDG